MSLSVCASSVAASSEPAADSGRPSVTPKALDGAMIEAVERYPNPKVHEIGFGLGLYPFKSYFYGFSLNGDYVHYFTKSFAWEVLNASYAFTVQTNLASQLAEDYGVNPESLERMRGVFSTNVMFVHSHGKLLFLDKFIRYFRSHAIAGLGMVTTSERNLLGVNLGIRFDAFITETFSWKVEIRDMITVNGFENFASFTLGTGINF